MRLEELSGLNPKGSPSSMCLPPPRAATAPRTSRMPSSCCCPCCRCHTSRRVVLNHSRDLARLRLVKEEGRPHCIDIYHFQGCFLHIWPQMPLGGLYKQFCTDSIENASWERVSHLLMYMVVLQIIVFYVNLNLHGFILLIAFHLKFIHQYSFPFLWRSMLYLEIHGQILDFFLILWIPTFKFPILSSITLNQFLYWT